MWCFFKVWKLKTFMGWAVNFPGQGSKLVSIWEEFIRSAVFCLGYFLPKFGKRWGFFFQPLEQLISSIYDEIPQLICDWQELVVIAGALIKQVSTRHSVNPASFLHLPATGILEWVWWLIHQRENVLYLWLRKSLQSILESCYGHCFQRHHQDVSVLWDHCARLANLLGGAK